MVAFALIMYTQVRKMEPADKTEKIEAPIPFWIDISAAVTPLMVFFWTLFDINWNMTTRFAEFFRSIGDNSFPLKRVRALIIIILFMGLAYSILDTL